MKRLVAWIFILSGAFIIGTNKDNLIILYARYVKETDIRTITYRNEYYRNVDYEYVQITDEFLIKSKKELLNVYYTVLNSGTTNFYFYCDESYDRCVDDVIDFANNQHILSNLNSFVHPYNSFDSIETNYNTFGRIEIKINRVYDDDLIYDINMEVDRVLNKLVEDTSDVKEFVKTIHDYIISISDYDVDKADKKITNYLSNTAYGPLLQGYAICSGYTDAMALFLHRYNIPNFKIVSENHIWNVVMIDGEWYHLDLTWNDPVLSDGTDTIDYTYFLITTEELLEIEKTQHNFDLAVFSEVIG